MESADSHDAQVQVPNQSAPVDATGPASTPSVVTNVAANVATNTDKPGLYAPGTIIGSSYEVIDVLGRGAMGVVYRVKHVTLPAQYALKILTDDKHDEVSVIRFQNEAQAIAKLNHPNIVSIYNFGVHEGSMPFYVMDLLDGEDLQDKIVFSGPRTQEEALSLIIEAASGLSYAHRKGILHRDVKPANFLILDKPDVQGARLKVVDFGIVKFADEIKPDAQKLTAMGLVCGSPSYMSPEQASGLKVDPRSDIYSLGCSLFEALTGKVPFRGRSVSETMMMHVNTPSPTLASKFPEATFSEDLETVVAKMMAKEPMYRYQSMDAVSQDLKNVLAGKPLGGALMAQSNFSASQVENAINLTQGSTGQALSRVDQYANEPLLRDTYSNEQAVSGEYGITGEYGNTGEYSNTGEYGNTGEYENSGEYAEVDEQAGERNALSNTSKLLLAALGVVVVIGAAGFFALKLFSPASVKLDGPVRMAEDKEETYSLKHSVFFAGDPDKTGPSAPVKLTSDKYFSKIVTVNGKKFVQFDFPTGTIGSHLAVVGPSMLERQMALGTVRFPVGKVLYMVPTSEALNKPEFFTKFRRGDITGLVMHSVQASDQLFNISAKTPGITELHILEGCSLTNKIVPMLTTLRGLKKVSIFKSEIKGSDLARADFWHNLNHLELQGCKQITPVMKKISGSRTLEILNIADCGAGPDDYKLISTVSSLKVLKIDKNRVSIEDLQQLSKLPNLGELSLINIHIKQTSMAKTLERFPSLRVLVIDPGHFKKQDLAYLNEHRPQLRIMFYRPADGSEAGSMFGATPDRL